MSFRPSGESLKVPTLLLAVAGFCGGVPMHAQRVAGKAALLQAVKDSPLPAAAHGPTIGVEFLTDTQGADLGPYIRQMLHTVNDGWKKRLAQEAVVPTDTPRTSVIRLALRPDGTIAGMRLEGTSREAALDRAAWASMTQVQSFSPLPATFTGPELEMRIRFNVVAAATPNVR